MLRPIAVLFTTVLLGCSPAPAPRPVGSAPEDLPAPNEDCAAKKAAAPDDGCACGCPPGTTCCGGGAGGRHCRKVDAAGCPELP